MTFTSCGQLHTINVSISGIMSARSAYHAVQFESIQRIKVIECIFHDSYGTALRIFSAVETICFLATVDDAKTVMNALDALEVGSVLKQVT